MLAFMQTPKIEPTTRTKILGFHEIETLPVKVGDTVVIQKGAWVFCSDSELEVRRTEVDETVTIIEILPGKSVPAHTLDTTWRQRVQDQGFDFTEFDLLKSMNNLRYRRIMAPVTNPIVRWQGDDGLECEADINDVLR